jgi:hypothetical protein
MTQVCTMETSTVRYATSEKDIIDFVHLISNVMQIFIKKLSSNLTHSIYFEKTGYLGCSKINWTTGSIKFPNCN